MTSFSYQARDDEGRLITGMLQAPTLADASRILTDRGQFPIEVTPASDHPSHTATALPARPSAGSMRKDVMWFVSQLAVMLESGITISEALACLARQRVSERFKPVISSLADAVQEGRPLSEAMTAHPRAFTPVIIALVRAGEMSGTMTAILQHIARYLVYEDRVRARIRAALVYPTLMFLLCIAVSAFLLMVIIPTFADLFAGRGAALPAPTRLLLAANHSLIAYWPWWIAGTIAACAALIAARQTQYGRTLYDHLALALPVIGPILRKLHQSRACFTLATMTRAGVPVTDTLELLQTTAGNVRFQQLWSRVAQAVTQGDRIAAPLYDSPLIPEPVAQMIDAGDRSANLPAVFAHLADVLEQEYDQSVKTATQLIEPAMILLMGSIVGFVCIALLLPLFTTAQVLAQ